MLKSIVFPIFYCCISLFLHASGRGIIVAGNDDYAITMVPSLHIIRDIHNCSLPIEVWHAGDELSEETKLRLRKIPNLTLHDIAIACGGRPEQYRGYQIKGYMMGATSFDEVILMDADVFFFQNPENLFEHPGYKKTGAFLFRDAEWQQFGDPKPCQPWYHLGKASFYVKRREYILSHVKQPSEYVPSDWRHYWDLNFIPTEKQRVSSEHVETGCIAMNRKLHQKGIEYTVAFNDDRKQFFSLFLGEKETFWLGLEKAKEPYYINPQVCYSYYPDFHRKSHRHDLVHFVDKRLFFLQKKPQYFPENPLLIYNRIHTHPSSLKNISQFGVVPSKQEIKEFESLAFFYLMYQGA